MMYDIEIDYTTGNSFGRNRETDLLMVPVSSLEMAKENLGRIKKHYADHHDSPDYGKRYQLTLLTDNGEHTISPFWIGYFETLHGAKIVTGGDSDMEFTL
jgi:hypothetical protein